LDSDSPFDQPIGHKDKIQECRDEWQENNTNTAHPAIIKAQSVKTDLYKEMLYKVQAGYFFSELSTV
jgi:hypothetical protein